MQLLNSDIQAASGGSNIIDFSSMGWSFIREKAPELPAVHSLESPHISDLKESGISPAQAASLGMCSVSAAEAYALTGHRRAGLLMPYFDDEGIPQRWGEDSKLFCRLKPTVKSDKGAKYLSPKGSGTFAYFPMVGGKREKRLIISEGEKTIGSFALHTDFDCIGLGGVWSFSTGTKAEGKPLLEPIKRKIFSKGYEEIILCFDSDIVRNPGVANAIASLAKSIMNAAEGKGQGGAQADIQKMKMANRLKFVILPQISGRKQGLDDLIYSVGIERVLSLFDFPMPVFKKRKRLKDDVGDTYECVFKAEPLYTGKANHDANVEAMARSRVLGMAMSEKYLRVPDFSPYEYSDGLGIWRPVGREAWADAFYKSYEWQSWAQRSRASLNDSKPIIEQMIARELDELDPLKYMGFKNGTLNLNTGVLEPIDPSHLVTRRAEYGYHPYRKPYIFLRWLGWAFEDTEVIDAIQGLLRWILEPKKGQYPHQLLFFCIGKPGVGKSTLMEVIKGLAGNAFIFDPQKLSEPEHLFSMRNKRVIYQPDLKGKMHEEAISTLNKLADNTEVGIRSLFRDGGQARLNTVVCMACNKPPQISVNDRAGFDRRAVYFNFTKKPEKRDAGFTNALLEELPGIYNWAMEITVEQAFSAILDYQGGELQQSVSLNAITDTNNILQWLDEWHDNPSEMVYEKSALYREYLDWCTESNSHAFAKARFSTQLNAMGVKSHREGNKASGKQMMTMPPMVKLNCKAIADI